MDFTTRYEKLNAAQKEAVDTIDGPVMVIAGPGTGKTELLSMRTANILQKTDTLPGSILCLTFTDSGANAMRQRLTQIIGANAYRVAIHTFHSFGTEIINQNGEFFYHGANFRAADELSCYELLRGIFDELDYNNPLASKMNGEYTHLGDTLSTISELKKSGLTSDELLAVLDANDKVIDSVEPLLASVFASRLSKTTAEQLAPLVKTIRESGEKIPLPAITPLSTVLSDSLEAAVNEALDTNSTKPVTAWRNAWMKKNEAGNFVLKSRERAKKLRAASYVYYQYLVRMQEAELYDFDDMILRVVHAMEVFPELRFNLQEKYQYIMVDEFQDTNMAQMRILYNLTNNEINEGRPNVLVVGDDDQAIYSFQGADVGNINGFRELYEQTKIITLTDNYRSTATVLSQARSVITQGQNRLENIISGLNKTLTPHRDSANSSVQLVELPTINDERQWLVDTVSASIKSGVSPANIAVLARRHHEIIALLPYFAKANIKVNYERRDNVLELETIKIIEHVARILVALFEKQHDVADSLLPELLAHPAFGVAPIDVWRLSLSAQQNHQKWMEIMAVTPALQPLHQWLVTQSQALAHMPLEPMLDEILGVLQPVVSSSPSPLSPPQGHSTGDKASPWRSARPDGDILSDETAETARQQKSETAQVSTKPLTTSFSETSAARVSAAAYATETRSEAVSEKDGGEEAKEQDSIRAGVIFEGFDGVAAGKREGNEQRDTYISPLFTYYFSEENLQKTPDLYLTHLEALRTIRTKLRDYQPNETPTLQSFLEFIRLHRRLGSTITSVRPHSERIDDAINLMTAHKSKGLEFDNVYVIGAIDSAWGERVRTRSRLISYPENLPLAPSGDTLDERLRLFFVAMTRARTNLTITYSGSNDGDKSTLRASFLAGENWQVNVAHPPATIESLTHALETIWYQPLVDPLQQTMQDLLMPMLENYKLSSTHLTNFLDVSRGGPHMFLMDNLLRFPRAMAPSAAYGSAVHATLQRAHSHFCATKKPRPLEDVLHDFEQNLLKQHLADKDFRDYLQKGSDALSSFLEAKYASFTQTQKTELNFAGQNVHLGKAHLTGSLDLVDINEAAKTIIVTDYKTGKAARDWNGKTDFEKIKLHRYKQQLMFYDLLVRHSRDYQKYTFEKAVLQFVEPTPGGEIIALEAHFSNEDLDRFGLLIQRVWQRIKTLDLPDVSRFEPSYKGVLEFEQALLDETV